MGFTRNRVRLALNVTTPFETPAGQAAILDFFLGSNPLIPHGRAAQFEVAVFQGGVLDAAIGLDSMTLELKSVANNIIDTGAPLLSKTIPSSGFNANLDKESWDAGVEYYALFELSEADLNLDLSSGAITKGNFTAKTFGLVFSGQGPNGRVDLAAGLALVLKSGATGLGTGAPPVPTYTYSDQEIAAALAGRLKAGINDPETTFTIPAFNNAAKGLKFRVVDPGDGGDVYLEQQQVVIPA
jgi:hypothetical protein